MDNAITVQWPSGYTMTYLDQGGHNVRLEGGGVVSTTGQSNLVEAIRWAGQMMAGSDK